MTEKQIQTAKSGEKFEHYRGRVWITLQDPKKTMQGVEIAVMDRAGYGTKEALRVILYVIRRGDTWSISGERSETLTLEHVVRFAIEQRFKTPDALQHFLGE